MRRRRHWSDELTPAEIERELTRLEHADQSQAKALAKHQMMADASSRLPHVPSDEDYVLWVIGGGSATENN